MKKYILSPFAFCVAVFSANAQTQTFNYTGSVQTFTVPPCVSSITVDVKGAQGGNDGAASGGLGGRVQGNLPVTPGDILYIYVGGAGITSLNSPSGGYNGGGGTFSYSNDGVCGTAGTGGGATDIRLNGTNLTNRVAVGGGGGGAGGYVPGNQTYAGGAGGTLISFDGVPWPGWPNSGGKGGNQTVGGPMGTACCGCPTYTTNGGLGTGGFGSGDCAGGGGGGGGYYGGGGSCFAGAGGGSNYASGTITGVTHTAGFQNGNGQVILTYTSSGSLPSGAGPITGPASVCGGATVTYSISSVSGATGYAWTVPVGATINSGQNTTSINVTFGTTSGSVTVTPNNSCGNGTPASLAVTVNPNPTVNLGPDVTQCGGTILLDAQNAGSTFMWSTTATTQTIVASTTGTYSVVVTNVGGCTGSDAINVTINTSPTVSVSASPTSYCAGGNSTVTAAGGNTYAWSPGTGLSATTGASVTANPTATTTYTVTGTAVNGCTATTTVTVTVNPAPNVNLGPDISTCGGTVNLNAGNPGSTYLWSTGATIQTITVNTTGTYSVTVTNVSGCSGSDAIVVTINTPPIVSLGPDISTCGSTVTLDALNPGSTYLWSNLATTQTIAVTTNGTYSVTVTDVNGCTGTDVITVTINTPPTVTYTQSPAFVCINWPAFTLTGGSPSGGTYSGTGVTANMFNPSAAGQGSWTITYVFTDVNGCSDSATQTISVDLCTGINETSNSSFAVYPNPTSGIINISSAENFSALSVTITDIQGKVVLKSEEKNITKGESRKINVSELANGVYYLKLDSGTETRMEKLIITK